MSDNPYTSPRTIDLKLKVQSAPRLSFLRGGLCAVVWGGAAFAIAPLAGAIARSTFLNDANEYRLTEILAQFKQLIGIGVFLGILFSLSAIANYTPAVRVGFVRTLLWTLLAFFTSSFLVFLASSPFEWPLSPPPQRYNYEPTIAEQFWNGAWIFSGTVFFTIYILWRRIGMPVLLLTSPPQSKTESEGEAV